MPDIYSVRSYVCEVQEEVSVLASICLLFLAMICVMEKKERTGEQAVGAGAIFYYKSEIHKEVEERKGNS